MTGWLNANKWFQLDLADARPLNRGVRSFVIESSEDCVRLLRVSFLKLFMVEYKRYVRTVRHPQQLGNKHRIDSPLP